MAPNYLDRRSVLRGLGTAAASGLVVGSASGHSPAQDKQLQVVKERTEKYREKNGGIQRALDDGFQIMGPYVPAMGWHLVNFDRIAEREQPGLGAPQGLTYNLDHELGSVEYIVPYDEEPPRMFSRGHEHRWHPHHSAQHVFSNHDGDYNEGPYPTSELLNPNNWIELTNSDHLPFPPKQPDLEEGDTLYLDGSDEDTDEEKDVKWGIVDKLITHDDWWTLHAWVHDENPNGVFAPFNPDF